MKTKSLIQFCNIFTVFTAFYGVTEFLGILNLCYKLGKDDTDTLLWQVLVQGIEAWGIIFCCILFFILTSYAKRGRIFIVENEKLMMILGSIIIWLGVISYVLINILSIKTLNTSAATMLCLTGMVFVFFSFIFKIGRKLKEDQELTI
jgi:hypothetical protein